MLVLAAFRVTRLIVKDDITEPLRKRTTYRLTGRWGELFSCPWCVSFWLCLVLVLAYWAWPEPILWLSLPFAASAGVGLIASNWD